MTDPFSTVATELPRDRWGRPLITPPEGGAPVAYQRVTTFVSPLEDTYHLSLWSQRMVVLGMARRRDLTLAASAITDPKDQHQKRTLNDLAKQAKDAAAGGAAATTGTALHSFTERHDLGHGFGDFVPEEYVADLAAYADVTKGLNWLGVEGFCVMDALRVGGTYDRILQFTEEFLDAYEAKHGQRMCYPTRLGREIVVKPGDAVIGDVKTGHVDLGAGKIAMQLGVYANSLDYDHTLGTRTPLAGNPSKDWAIVIHLPAGTGTARLLWFDIAAGFEAARTLAVGVHAWRKRDDLTHVITSTSVTAPTGPTIVELIKSAQSYVALQTIYTSNVDKWTPGLTALAKERTAELEGATK